MRLQNDACFIYDSGQAKQTTVDLAMKHERA
jgi:hypothetical protein